MKKIYLALVAMLLLMSMPQAEAARHQIVTRGDTMMVVDDGDTAVIVGMGLGKIKARVERALNDTLLDAGQVSSDTVDGDVVWKVNGQRADVDLQAINDTWAGVARKAMRDLFFWIAVIVFLGLLFGYLRRRSQNRVIERAIENNYPLPDGLYGHRQTPRTIYVQQPIVTQAPTLTPPPADAQAPAQGTATPPPLMSPAYLQHGRQVTSDMINLRALYPAFKWIAVGLALALFFMATDNSALACLMLGIVFIGVGKGVIAYQEQRTLAAHILWQQEQERLREQEQQQRPAEQRPVTPPPFEPTSEQ